MTSYSVQIDAQSCFLTVTFWGSTGRGKTKAQAPTVVGCCSKASKRLRTLYHTTHKSAHTGIPPPAPTQRAPASRHLLHKPTTATIQQTTTHSGACNACLSAECTTPAGHRMRGRQTECVTDKTVMRHHRRHWVQVLRLCAPCAAATAHTSTRRLPSCKEKNRNGELPANKATS